MGSISSRDCSWVTESKQLPCRLHALGKKHAILAGTALGARDEVIDLFDESSKKGLLFDRKTGSQCRQRDVGGMAHGYGRRSNKGLTIYAAMRKFRNLFVNIDIDIKKTCWILMDDAFLLPIKKVEQATIFLQLILKGCHDVMEFFLEFHIWEVGLGCLIICA